MLATETQAIADYLKETMIEKYGVKNIAHHFADTRDTLCYATNDNQDATYELLETDADFALVVGGYNSSNTSHIVELCERKYPTYFYRIPFRNKILCYHSLFFMKIEMMDFISGFYLLVRINKIGWEFSFA